MVGFPSPPSSGIPHEVKYDAVFDDRAASLIPDENRRNEILESIEFIVAGAPTSGTRVADTLTLYRLVYYGTPRLSVIYTFDGSIVWMRHIEELEETVQEITEE